MDTGKRWNVRKLTTEVGIILLISAVLSLAYNVFSPYGLQLRYQPPPQAGSVISTAQLQSLIRQGAIVVDVRSVDEFRTGHIPEAHNLPLRSPRAAKMKFASAYEVTQQFVFYCSSANCNLAQRAAGEFGLMGFKNTFLYEAGIDGWQNAGLPLERE